MTLANKITIIRILLIPVFVWLVLDYVGDYRQVREAAIQHTLACVIFALAAVSDAVDGYIARRYNQKSELGTFLDPLADKALLISALILLSRDTGGAFHQLPRWFPVLVISRDVLLLGGALLIHLLAGKVAPRPRIVGKLATFFQMMTLGWTLLRLPLGGFHFWLYAAGAFTFVSGVWYVLDGVKQLNVSEKKP
jgi:CDP-diacylglycerol--glycerol-3-phosphate 3-phosphatidyltransferase